MQRRDRWRDALTTLWGIVSFAAGGGGGGDAACLTAGDRIKREGGLDCGNDGGMKVCDDYDNREEEEKEEEDFVASAS